MAGCSDPVIVEQPRIDIIPKPLKIESKSGIFIIDKSTNITANGSNDAVDKLVANFNANLWENAGFKLLFNPNSEFTKNNIHLEVDPEFESDSSEGYSLQIDENGVLIKAKEIGGIFYGLQSLRQLWVMESKENERKILVLPFVTIFDAPRHSWRGVMLDESRHFFGVDKVKQLLEMMAIQKLNKFHWHLTDAPGWRIEILAYPKLTSIGAIGNHSNATAEAAFYTQEEIKDIVAYARERNIEVIPEIDMPGHASAAVRSYPELSGGGSKKHPEFTFHPAKIETYSFLTTVLKEMGHLFPSEYIHIGADEVSFGNQQWANDAEVKKLMKNEGLSTIKEVETYFINRIQDTILSLNKKVIGWDEVVENDMMVENTTVMWWRHDRPEVLKKALDKGYNTVLCPRLPLYFDFDQHESHKLGRRWSGFGSLKDVYHFPDSLNPAVQSSKYVLGIQANVWTERINTEERFDFMVYTRMSALSETAWTTKENKSFEDFENRLKKMFDFYEQNSINYFNHFDPDATPEPGKKLEPNWTQNF